MSRRTKFSIGERWYCDRSNLEERDREPFTFVIIGPGSRPDYKLCRLECDNPKVKWHGMEQEYSHIHLKRCAVNLDWELKNDS
jgi:hypothetical protein